MPGGFYLLCGALDRKIWGFFGLRFASRVYGEFWIEVMLP